ncbi:hypothetical protein NP493_556g00001 [Ridgeia piscesae]|uniref:Uncharacterized protein n=1 Tax=Ridgeia piscesae TaxID=27915 RepID=A0AAD9KV12_RIDPI|nr:hypothetical protein NP493_556g00001 [Ridgeia piscesae]
MTGARYCGHATPDNEIKSETREIILIFKSNFTTTWQSNRKGFKVEVVAVPYPNAVTSAATTAAATVTSPKPATVTSSTAATVTSPTTTTTATRTTTTTTTTTTKATPTTTKANEGASWSELNVWRNSACACGGCNVQMRHRMCGDQKCSLEETESRPCDRLCTKDGIRYVFVGRMYETPCPVCCIQYGFHLSGDKCIED